MEQPNVLLVMCDDLGYGDTGFNGNRVIHTPHLDELATEGAVFTRFYAGGPVCSPTRGTCLTGRHYSRYGINHANVGHLPVHEISLSRIAKSLGYATGHFGKWHLGTLNRTHSAKPGRKPEKNYAPPWERWYDESFCTEFAVPTWNPTVGFDVPTSRRKDSAWESPYYHNGRRVEDPLLGCDSKLIMDRTLEFVRTAAAQNRPFFASVWFHAPHAPVEAGPEFLAMYEDYPDDYAHYYGVVTAMDRQVGRLNRAVQELGIENNTLVFFCSDNGPEGYGEYLRDRPGFRRSRGSSGGLRGRKRSLYNGGIAVPAVVKWPGRVSAGSTYDFPASTLDYLPTLIDHWSFQMPDDRPLDGESLIPLIDEAESGEVGRRRSTIPYRFVERRGAMFGSPTFAAIGNRFKLLTNLDADPDDLSQRQLFDLRADPYEEDNVIDFYPDEAEELQEFIESKMGSFKASHYGADYGEGSGGGFDAGSGGEEWESTEPFLDVDRSWSGE